MAKHDDMPRHDDPTELEPRPRPASDRGPHATTAQLRQDIDSGATGDKVRVFDPAASPLGTDAEASGVPPSPAAVAEDRELERSTAPSQPSAAERALSNGGFWFAALLLGLALLAVILAWAGRG